MKGSNILFYSGLICLFSLPIIATIQNNAIIVLLWTFMMIGLGCSVLMEKMSK